MARALKTYTTAAGFFELAIAAPSMKAALEAWGSPDNLFRHGFARMTDDPEIVAATRAKPGVVLRRAVGSKGRFSENAELPKELPVVRTKLRNQRAPKAAKPPAKAPRADHHDRSAGRTARRTSEAEQARRETDRQEREAARRRGDEARKRAVTAAEEALREGRRRHDSRTAEINEQRVALDQSLADEESRWREKQRELKNALRAARSGKHRSRAR